MSCCSVSFGDGSQKGACQVTYLLVRCVLTGSQTSSGNTLALQVDGEGTFRYDAIALQGHREGKYIQSQFKDLVPLAHRRDLNDEAKAMERPSEGGGNGNCRENSSGARKDGHRQNQDSATQERPGRTGEDELHSIYSRATREFDGSDSADYQDDGSSGRSNGAAEIQAQESSSWSA